MTTRRNKAKGGAATAFPLKYFDPSVHEPNANAGRDLLKAEAPLGVRPRIGGKRTAKRVLKKRNKRTKKTKGTRRVRIGKKRQFGGFVPSVMGNFVEAASKYIVPLVLYAGYNMLTKKNKKGGKKSIKKH
jgi:hypothetical protein